MSKATGLLSEDGVAKLFEELKPMFGEMKEMGVAVMKVTPNINGHRPFSIIVVVGEEEVADVTKAIEAVEAKWES